MPTNNGPCPWKTGDSSRSSRLWTVRVNFRIGTGEGKGLEGLEHVLGCHLLFLCLHATLLSLDVHQQDSWHGSKETHCLPGSQVRSTFFKTTYWPSGCSHPTRICSVHSVGLAACCGMLGDRISLLNTGSPRIKRRRKI